MKSLANTYDYGTLMHMGIPSVLPVEKKTIGKNCNVDIFSQENIMQQDGTK